MKNMVKNGFYSVLGLSLIGLNSASAAFGVGEDKVDRNLVGSESGAVDVVQNWIAILTTFLAIIAVVMILWAAFNILTAGGDEEKVKKGKTTIIQAVIGLLVVFIAYSVVTFVIDTLFVSPA